MLLVEVPNYTEMILQPLLSGIQESTAQLLQFIADLVPVLLPLVGASALIFLGVQLFAKIVNTAIAENEHANYMASVSDYIDDFSIMGDDLTISSDWLDDEVMYINEFDFESDLENIDSWIDFDLPEDLPTSDSYIYSGIDIDYDDLPDV